MILALQVLLQFSGLRLLSLLHKLDLFLFGDVGVVKLLVRLLQLLQHLQALLESGGHGCALLVELALL